MLICRKYFPLHIDPQTHSQLLNKMGYYNGSEPTEYYKKLVRNGSKSVIGVDNASKPIPKLMIRHKDLFKDATVLEIGAGLGRLVKFGLENGVKSYTTIEPHLPFVRRLMKIEDPRLRVIPDLWENVREQFINQHFDILILWDVLMFMDLTRVHSGSYEEAVLKEIPYFARMSDTIFLSLHPVKSAIVKNFKEILAEFLKAGFCLVDKVYLNYLLIR